MGTRGLLGHILRSKNLRKAAYNHFDSYGTGLGCQLVRFIKSPSEEQIRKVMEQVANIEWIDDERTPAPQDLQDRYQAFGFADVGVAGQRSDDWYCLLRNVQGAASLPHILDGTLKHQVDSTSFEKDELFCEWRYFVDWEGRELHVKGWGKEGKVSFGEMSTGWMAEFERSARETSE